MIKIIDNFFTEEIHYKINELMDRPKWRLSGGDIGNRFWHMDNLQTEEYFYDYLFNIIQDKLGINTRIKRIYANGQTVGQNGVPHSDSIDDISMTFLYYPNLQWKFIWGGHLTFLDIKSNSKILAKKITNEMYNNTNFPVEISDTVSYVPNRGVLFPSNIWHYAHSPHRSFTGLRVSLAYKLELI
tara:strand:+ start:119 stop:673 length:555 start_codon:yes stop_codon:yes gene_type:complete